MSNEIINLAYKIKESHICKNCKGPILNGVCIYCDTIYEELNIMIKDLNNKLDYIDISKVNQMSDVMNAIYLLKGMGMEKVDSLLLRTKYEEIIKNKYNEIHNKINNGDEFNNNDFNNYEFLMFNYEKEENKIFCCNYVIKSVLLNKVNFPYEFVKKVIICFTEKVAEQSGLKCHASIGQLEENLNGVQFYSYIRLDNRVINDFYYNHKSKLIETIFHEITHIMQDKRQKRNSVVSLPDYIQIKDIIISEVNKEFYDDNYVNITFENEARLNGAIYSVRYLKSLLNYQIAEYEKEELEKINFTIAQNENLLRIYRGTDVNVEDIFDEIIRNNPNYLTFYPSLRHEYKETEAGQVVRKTLEEIDDDFFNIDFSTLDGNKFKALKELYRYIRNNAKNKEINMSY